MRKASLLTVMALFLIGSIQAQEENVNKSKFRQLWELPTPNVYRTASGAPGHLYWQQKADYEIEVELNEDKNQIIGKEEITYTNNSPDELRYVWLQLDQNMRAPDSETYTSATGTLRDKMTWGSMQRVMGYPEYDGGHKIQKVTDGDGKAMKYTINHTMMRVDLNHAFEKRR